MVAVIKTGHSIARILNYNESKVKDGVAHCISACNYPMEAEALSFNNKLNRLVNQAALNENVTRNSIHISLNFQPDEQLSKEALCEIAASYMQQIGFGNQPYLVYQHLDAGHPHIHIVSVKVRADGSRIDTQNIGRNQSEIARQEIEKTFALKRSQGIKKQAAGELRAVNATRVQYGKSETKRAIQNVLDVVVNAYKYTSLAELNAVLKQYNVEADRGGENSRIYNNHGLVYRILDEQGNKVGVPIKASLFYSKPTLKYLEGKFASNNEAREPFKARVKNAVDLAFLRHPKLSLSDLTSALKKEGINTLIRQNKDGIVYGLTFVDHQTKCVFNGSDLGKAYSAKGVMERLYQHAGQGVERTSYAEQKDVLELPALAIAVPKNSVQQKEMPGVLETLIKPDATYAYVPGQLSGKGRKRKKKNKSKGI